MASETLAQPGGGMTSGSSMERRRAPRVETRLPLSLGDRSAELLTTTHNISASGAYCTVRKFLAPMTKLQVRLELPGDHRALPIECQGVVVRVEPPEPVPRRATYRVAIFFNDLSERDRDGLVQFVQARLTILLRRG